MEELFVATNNEKKLEEIKYILDSFNLKLKILSPKDFNSKEEPIENGNTYKENATIKAKFYHDLYKYPTLADDSGIEIEYFDGKPGIYSARFLPRLNYKEKCMYILNEIGNSDKRKAEFHCSLAYIDSNNFIKTYEKILYGSIANSLRGDNGFGYDPIFIAEGNTMTNAELPKNKKNEFSHRYLVLREWANDLKNK